MPQTYLSQHSHPSREEKAVDLTAMCQLRLTSIPNGTLSAPDLRTSLIYL